MPDDSAVRVLRNLRRQLPLVVVRRRLRPPPIVVGSVVRCWRNKDLGESFQRVAVIRVREDLITVALVG